MASLIGFFVCSLAVEMYLEHGYKAGESDGLLQEGCAAHGARGWGNLWEKHSNECSRLAACSKEEKLGRKRRFIMEKAIC